MTDKVNFGDELVEPEEKTRRVGAVFSSVARRYDLMNDLMSGGLHRLWKDRFVARVKPRPGERILDMAGGTGDVAFRMARRGAQVTVADINADMLEVGSERAKQRGIDGLEWQVEDAESLTFADRSFDAYTIAFGIRNVTDIPAALREAYRVLEARRALLLPRILDQRMAGLRRRLRGLCEQGHPAHRQGGRRRRGELSLSGRIDPPLPAARGVPADDRRRRLRPRRGRADARRAGRDPQRLEDLTASVTHLWRLLKWGRTLARHGALHGHRGRSADSAAGAPAGRGSRASAPRPPATPDYAKALQEIGPAAIKLGQALSTRPDLVGDRAAENLSQLQDDLPPAPFPAIKAAIEAAFETPLEQSVRELRPGAGRRRVDRPGPPRGHHRRPRRRGQGAAARASSRSSPRRSRPTNGRRRMSKAAAASSSGCGRGWWSPISSNGPRASSTSSARRASASELRENMVAEPGFFVPEIDWRRTARRVLTLEWLDGIKLNDRDALVAAGHDCKALAAILVRAFLRQAVVDGFFHADLHQGNLFALPDGRIAVIDFGIMGRIDRRARMWLAEILYGLITGNYRRVAEIHFEAQYVPPHHNVEEFATALARRRRADPRAAGQGHFGRADARKPVRDHPRFRHADPAALAAAAEDHGDGGRRRDQRSIPTSTCGRPPSRSCANGCAPSSGPKPITPTASPSGAGVEDDPAADPPDRRILPAARRRAAAAAAARDRGDRAAALVELCAGRLRPVPRLPQC